MRIFQKFIKRNMKNKAGEGGEDKKLKKELIL
jgi:hypothetical protein